MKLRRKTQIIYIYPKFLFDILIFLSAFQLFLRIYVKMISGEGKK